MIGLLNLPLARQGSFWFPPQSSSFSAGHDFVYDLILWLCVLFFVGICGATVYFAIKYRKRPGHKEEVTATHNTRLEVTWSVAPLVLLMLIFAVSTYWYLEMITPPEDDIYELNVRAQKWRWAFTYSGKPLDGMYECKDMHVILDRNYQAVMTAPDNDVLHSMFIPAFRVKQDCVPGRYNRLWFRPTELSPPEGFDLFCTEYCGDSHSNMVAKVHVYETEAEWIAGIKRDGDLDPKDPVDRGRILYERNCKLCHSIEPGVNITGPSWWGLYGSTRKIEGGTVTADIEYIRESIITPGAKVAKGFPPKGMTAFDWGDKNELYIDKGIVEFMKTLNDKGGE